MFIQEFYKICQQFPQHVAIKEGEQTIQYQELLDRVMAVSHEIRKKETKQPVLIYIEKSIDYVVSVLATWWSGKAFVPLSNELPEERVEFIIKETKTELVLTNQISDFNGIKIINPQKIDDTNNSGFFFPTYQKKDLAYIFFTSGSTGKPKGVMVQHQGLMLVLKAQIEAFELTEQTQSLWYLSHLFDASLSDLGTSLLVGACLHIVPKTTLLNLTKFYQYLHKEQISYIDIPPSVLSSLSPHEVPNSLETLVIGGESCSQNTINQWINKVNLINVYGPTEATICTSFAKCKYQNIQGYWSNIGPPVAGNIYHIFDGELYIEGQTLALGYLNNKELTREKFVIRNGKRLYKTGDAVKKDSQGKYHFLHRIDRQFKINGKLVEPYEIENLILSFEGIKEVAVVHQKQENRSLLIACLQVDISYQEQSLRMFLQKKLPAWMHPHRFILMNSFPVNQHHKVDYQQLLENISNQSISVIQEKIGNKEMLILKDIWEEVLKQKNISIHDNFYHLGGDSLALMLVLAKAHTKGLKLTAENLYHHQTVYTQILGQEKYSHSMPVKDLKRVGDNLLYQIDISQSIIRKPTTKSILVTGATGFLGSNLLIAILQKEELALTSIYCLVRGNDKEVAKKRVLEKIQKLDAYQSHFAQRIQIILGDVSKEKLGMSIKDWENYTHQITEIYHCAAEVNMMKTFDELYQVNVLSTIELAKFICTKNMKNLHYASTLSVFVGSDQNEGTFYEYTNIDQSNYLYGGYAQTKWLSEYIISQLNFPKSIYRFGLLTGNSITGVGLHQDYLGMFIRALAKVKCVPKEALNLAVDITPINLASEAFLEISIKSSFETYHIANQQRTYLQEIVVAMQLDGYEIEVKSTQAFLETVTQSIHKEEASLLKLAFCKVIASQQEYTQNHTFNLFQASNTHFSHIKTKEQFLKYSLKGVSKDLLRSYVKFYLITE